jgi:hypothetical protein
MQGSLYEYFEPICITTDEYIRRRIKIQIEVSQEELDDFMQHMEDVFCELNNKPYFRDMSKYENILNMWLDLKKWFKIFNTDKNLMNSFVLEIATDLINFIESEQLYDKVGSSYYEIKKIVQEKKGA